MNNRPSLLVLLTTAVSFLLSCSVAFAQTSIVRVPIPQNQNVYWNPCDLEYVLVDGDIQLRSHIREDASGGIHITLREQLINVVGVSVDDGDVYRIVGHTAQSDDYDSLTVNLPSGGSFVSRRNIVYQMVPVGADNDGERYFAKVSWRTTVAANGDTAVDDFDVKVTCDSQPN